MIRCDPLMPVLLAGILCMTQMHARAEIVVHDDTGSAVRLARPAQRVVSLAPHVTELLYAAGGGGRIIGAVRFSDYPPEATRIPRVGDNQQVDLERLVSLKPDLLVVWRHDGASRQMDQLRALGVPLYYSDPAKLDDLPRTLRHLGLLMGTVYRAAPAADALERRIAALAARYGGQRRVKVFYQVWGKPLYTLNERHIITDAIRTCGGENVFAALPSTTPLLVFESVLQADPEVIISGDRPGHNDNGAGIWKAYPGMQAVRRGNLFSIDADLVNRPGPRFVDGAERLCEHLEVARNRGSAQ